ncbi:MAG: translation initiation factor IF-2 [Verrucomicrobiales bacterium]
MASKSSTAKTGEEPSTDPTPDGVLAPAPEAKPGALDLLSEKPKRVRKKPDAAEVPSLPAIGKPSPKSKSAPPPPPPPSAPAEPAGPTLDELKDNALSLFDEDEAKSERKRKLDEARAVRAAAAAQILKPISKIHAAREEAKVEAEARLFQQLHAVTGPAAEPPESTDSEEGESEEEEAGEDEEIADPKVIHLKPPVIVKDLAERLGIKSYQIIKELMTLDIFANQNSAIEPDIAAKVCESHGFIFEREKRKKGEGVHKVEEAVTAPPPPEPEPEVEKLKPRPPIVTIMGHVDHGKTSLLDYIRKSKVAAGEAGGITQHLGAYAVEHEMGGEKKPIVFLDTPGHAAFSAMRARGANLTDIVVLVVAADDGMMPTTHEALAHARAAGVKIVVAINKCDLPRADVNKVKQQLQANDLMPEDWGGSTSCVEISALKGTNVDQLLEIILLEAELLELKADPKAPVRAIAIESRVEAGKGPTATIIASTGTIRAGMPFICGQNWGKVRGLLNDRGELIKSAGPAIPCEVIGFSGPPAVGDEVLEMKSERDAKRLSEERTNFQRLEKLAHPRRNRMEDLFASIDSSVKVLRLILKADAAGSVEAIVGALKEIKSEKVTLDFAATGAGPITENDVLLASATDAVIIGFNTKVETKGVAAAKREGIQIKLFSIIYELIDQVRDAMLGLLDPLTRERIIGHALVKQVFKVQRGYAAGCGVTDGRVTRTAHARVLRGGTPVFDGKMSTLRRYTEEVQEVRNGLECGIRLGSFDDYEEGDVIECYELEKLNQTL